MSERPQSLQLLKRGKLLCSAVFPAIVETWNWLVEAFDGLKGDYDLNREEGSITVDRTDPAHPVIRLAKPVKAEAAPSPSGGGVSNFNFSGGAISGGVVAIARRYYKVNGLTPAEGETALPDGDYRLKFSNGTALGGAWDVQIEQGDGFAAPSGLTSYAPLFKIENGAIKEDYRAALHLMVRE